MNKTDPLSTSWGVARKVVKKAPPLYWFMVTYHPASRSEKIPKYISDVYWMQGENRDAVLDKLVTAKHGLGRVAEKGFLTALTFPMQTSAQEYVESTQKKTYLHFDNGQIICIAPVGPPDIEYVLNGESVPFSTCTSRTLVMVRDGEGKGLAVMQKHELVELSTSGIELSSSLGKAVLRKKAI